LSFVIIFGTHIQGREDADGLEDNKGLLVIKLLHLESTSKEQKSIMMLVLRCQTQNNQHDKVCRR
jgi:hypothetical protein